MLVVLALVDGSEGMLEELVLVEIQALVMEGESDMQLVGDALEFIALE